MESEEKYIPESGNPEELINSIKNESEEKIVQIQMETDTELKEIENRYDEYIKKVQEKSGQDTDELINDEIQKMENRGEIEKRKMRLNKVDEFISLLIKKSLSDLKESRNDLYEKYLEDSIKKILLLLKGNRAVIRLSHDDVDFISSKLDELKKNINFTGEVVILEDRGILSGGVIIENSDMGFSYNVTIERVIFRNRDEIRKNALDRLDQYIERKNR